MKTHQTSLLLLNLAVTLAGAFAAHAAPAPVSTSFTFQGQLKNNNGAPVNGPHDIQVKLYTTSNGQTLVGSPNENLFPCQSVDKGLINLVLNFGGAATFNGEERWLEFAVRPCNSTAGFQTLAPRVRLLPTPYAIQSLSALHVDPNGVTASSLQDDSITAGKIQSSQVVKSLNNLQDAVRLVGGANVTITPKAGNVLEIADTTIWSLNGANACYSAGNVGIGTMNPSKRLEVQGPGDVEIGLQSTDAVGTRLWTLQSSHGLPGIGVPNPLLGSFQIIDRTAGASRLSILNNGRVGIGTTEPSRNLEVQGGGDVEIGLQSTSARGRLWTLQSTRVAGDPLVLPWDGCFQIIDRTAGASRLAILDTGDVGLGTIEPTRNLEVQGAGDVEIGLKSTDPGGHLWTLQSSGTIGNPLDATFQVVDRTLGVSRLRIDSAGTIGWGTSTLGLDQGGSIELGNSFGNGNIPYLDFHLGVGADQDFNMRLINNADHLLTVEGGSLKVENGDLQLSAGHTLAASGRLHIQANEDLYLNPFGGAGTVYVGGGGGPGNLHVVGSASVCSLTIRGGCDLAEPFEMSDREIPKGSLVIIDEENAGKLKLAGQEYDTRVAGIISGANGINPGISLHQDGLIDGGQNVALSGRVYALADASNGPIKPGDLLTSSNTPGHVMKVTDHERAQGAIVGKAMSALKDGRGMVLVLVSLQ